MKSSVVKHVLINYFWESYNYCSKTFFYFTLIFVEFCFENASLQPKVQKKNNIPDEVLTQI